jgi:hypothetical protein
MLIRMDRAKSPHEGRTEASLGNPRQSAARARALRASVTQHRGQKMPAKSATSQKANYIPYAFCFLIFRAFRGQSG